MSDLNQPENKAKISKPVIIAVGMFLILLAVGVYYFKFYKKVYPPVLSQNPDLKIPLPNIPKQATPYLGNVNSETYKSEKNADVKLLFYSANSLKMTAGEKLVTLADYSKQGDSVGTIKISPNGEWVVFGHFNYEKDGGGAGLYTSGINTIAIASLEEPYTQKDIGELGKRAKWHFNWSPDSKMISYVINDGKGVEVFDLEKNLVILSLEGKQTGPLIWLNNDIISFVQDNKLYTGTLSNPKAEVVAQNVNNTLPVFEGPAYLVAPSWSNDKRFVSYYAKDSYEILDTKLKKTYKAQISKQTSEATGLDYLNINPLGWDKENNFFYYTNDGNDEQGNVKKPRVLSFNASSETQEKFVNLYAGPDTILYQLSEDGDYFVYAPSKQDYSSGLRYGFTINFPGQNGYRVCNNALGFVQGPAGNKSQGWSKKHKGLVVVKSFLPEGYTLSIIDLVGCRVVDNLVISNNYGPNGLDFAGIQ